MPSVCYLAGGQSGLQSPVYSVRWEEQCCQPVFWPNYLQGRGSDSSHNEVAGLGGVRSQDCGSLLTLPGNTLTLLMWTSDKWADYFLISQPRNCWERPWRLWDRRQRPNTCDVSLLLTFPSDHLWPDLLFLPRENLQLFPGQKVYLFHLTRDQTARPRGRETN